MGASAPPWCLRWACGADSGEVGRLLELPRPPWVGASWNVWPHDERAVVARDAGGAWALRAYGWGLVARSVHEAEACCVPADDPAALRPRRCLVPATGYYLRARAIGGPPWFVRAADQPLAMLAGLWEARRTERGDARRFALVTCPRGAAATPSAPVEATSPVILPWEAWEAWLDPRTSPDALASMLVPYPAELTIAHPVDTRVAGRCHNDRRLVEPIQGSSGGRL